jgi:hypothetical protein
VPVEPAPTTLEEPATAPPEEHATAPPADPAPTVTVKRPKRRRAGALLTGQVSGARSTRVVVSVTRRQGGRRLRRVVRSDAGRFRFTVRLRPGRYRVVVALADRPAVKAARSFRVAGVARGARTH